MLGVCCEYILILLIVILDAIIVVYILTHTTTQLLYDVALKYAIYLCIHEVDR